MSTVETSNQMLEIAKSNVSPVVELYRFGKHLFKGKSYNAICTLIYVGDIVYVVGLCGKFNRACYRELEAYLRDKGITKGIYERRKHIERRVEVI